MNPAYYSSQNAPSWSASPSFSASPKFPKSPEFPQSPMFSQSQVQWAAHALHWLSPDLDPLHALLNIPNTSLSGIPLGGTCVMSGDNESDLLSLAWSWIPPLIQSECFEDPWSYGVFWINSHPHSQKYINLIPEFHSHHTVQSITDSPWWYSIHTSDPLLQTTQALQHPFFSLVIVELNPFEDLRALRLDFLHHQALIFKKTLILLHPQCLSSSTLLPRFAFVPHLHLVVKNLNQQSVQSRQDKSTQPKSKQPKSKQLENTYPKRLISIESDFFGRTGQVFL